MNNNKTNVRFLAQLGLLAAIEIVMKLIGLGSVPVGIPSCCALSCACSWASASV